MTPQRIQRKRTAGWRMPEGAVYVGRPTKWGNPYRIEDLRTNLRGLGETMPTEELREFVVEMFREDLTYGPDSRYWWYGPHMQIIAIKGALQSGELRGKDLACWCPLDQPCHADVLLSLAAGGDGS
jgi:hypothetical protein